MAKKFEKNKDNLILVADAFQKMEYRNIGILSAYEDYHFVHVYDELPVKLIPLSDKAVFEAVNNLKKPEFWCNRKT